MDPATAAVIASVGSSAVSTGGGLLGQIAANRANRKLAEYAYSKDLEMWNRQNEYNLPINQMARLEQAGLNPNLMYGTGQGANVAKEMPKYNSPTMSYDVNIPNMISTISAFQDIKVKQAQVDNINAQTETRELENKLRSGTLEIAIADAANKMNMNFSKAQIAGIAANVQDILYRDYTQVEQAKSQLGITQATASRARSEAELKDLELSIVRSLEKVGKQLGIDTDRDIAGFVTKIIQALLLRR